MTDKCQNIVCPKTKICNPSTGKCVLRTGKVGVEVIYKNSTIESDKKYK